MTDQAYSTRFEKVEDLKAYIGKEIGLTEWMTITQETINTFAEATGDHQWIHTEPQMAKMHSPYGKTIAHGFLVLSLAPQFIYESHHIDNAIMAVNYGLDKVRFPAPTPVDGEIRARITLMEFNEMESGSRHKLNITFELKGSDKPSCTAEFIAMVITEDREDI